MKRLAQGNFLHTLISLLSLPQPLAHYKYPRGSLDKAMTLCNGFVVLDVVQPCLNDAAEGRADDSERLTSLHTAYGSDWKPTFSL